MTTAPHLRWIVKTIKLSAVIDVDDQDPIAVRIIAVIASVVVTQFIFEVVIIQVLFRVAKPGRERYQSTITWRKKVPMLFKHDALHFGWPLRGAATRGIVLPCGWPEDYLPRLSTCQYF